MAGICPSSAAHLHPGSASSPKLKANLPPPRILQPPNTLPPSEKRLRSRHMFAALPPECFQSRCANRERPSDPTPHELVMRRRSERAGCGSPLSKTAEALSTIERAELEEPRSKAPPELTVRPRPARRRMKRPCARL